MLNCYRRLDGRMRLVIHDLEIPELIFKDGAWLSFNVQLWQRKRLARQLKPGLLEVIGIKMYVTAGPDKISGKQVALLRKHIRQQCIRRDVEWHS